MKHISTLFFRLFSTSAAGLYIILFAFSISLATFIENDFGTSSAQKLIFKAWYFELLLVLFSISIMVNMFRLNLIRQRKWGTFAFHMSVLIILLGSAITRYSGYEGMMHIREGSSSDYFLSSNTYLQHEVNYAGNTYTFHEPLLLATRGNNRKKYDYLIEGQRVKVEISKFIPNPIEVMREDEGGVPTLQIVIGGANGREEYSLKYGQRSRIGGMVFSFGLPEEESDFYIKKEDGQLYVKPNKPFTVMQMASQKRDSLAAGFDYPLQLRSLYSDGLRNIVFGEYLERATSEITSNNPKMTSTSTGAVQIKFTRNDITVEKNVFGAKGIEGKPGIFSLDDMTWSVSYGARRISLPFRIHLRDFIMEKYPGTSSASSYASEITLEDRRKDLQRDKRIYMNHILNYNGYRFFQSSFDKDEQGTYLSVNHDAWGTWVSYLGYAILTLGMILAMFNKKGRLRQLAKNLTNARQKSLVFIGVIGLGFLPVSVVAADHNDTIEELSVINATHASKFARILIQDHRGRIKPMDTYAKEIMRKLSGKETINGQSAEQIILGMVTNPMNWSDVPLIKMGKHQQTVSIVGTGNKLASYADFFNLDNSYKLSGPIRNAYNTPNKDRGVFEKEMLKLDERISICSMIFSGRFLKAFPVADDVNNSWIAPSVIGQQEDDDSQRPFSEIFYAAYIPALQSSLSDNDWTRPNQMIDELSQFQYQIGGSIIPPQRKINSEFLLNRIKVFNRLAQYYGLLALIFLILMFITVFRPNVNVKWPLRIALALFTICFFLHLFGLSLRWYVSGRAPWSNGYESMIYISFTTVLAGLIISRKSLGGLAATSVLAATILMVAAMSWLDPEITPLVPVLKSYWLTIHVSLVAGSYGFLMLGALIGVFNLIFIILRSQNNATNVNRIVKELTQISEMTLIGGLFMLCVGTYLGGVWANESWGRYWGWDAKETWALVTILIYVFILHMRFIPGLRGTYAFNAASLVGWASVLMTYFGVNYYLSGLHSYAAGDPVPIPSSIYYSAVILTGLSIVAFWRNRQYYISKGTSI